jgi:hypothetical protein
LNDLLPVNLEDEECLMLRWSNLVAVLLVVQAVVYVNADAEFKQSRNMRNDAVMGVCAWFSVRQIERLRLKGKGA